MHQMIIDLALMLLTAGVVAVVFRKIRQPMVLGYILAGFLVGPYMPFFFTVEDTESIETWSEIGIIILMFGLGLEFNLHKLFSVGKSAIITALTEVGGMLLIGYLTGRLMGWSTMDALFLGGMLSMSSTTIIIKAFDELNVGKKSFAQLVFGILVIEDIAGIFMMIILSTVSVSKTISGTALVIQIVILMLYLVLWLMLGIFILPTLLNRASDFLNDETLLLLSLGICFGMVLLADRLGFSSALGAFLAGSLLAGTVHAERVEHLSVNIKDLFGAVFFLSVGMMIDPAKIITYALPILIITLVTIVFKIIISTFGVLLSGQRLKKAVYCGCSLGQIGEFAFIIASLGMSLGVIEDFVYPIIVSVSVVTTLTTPFFIKGADNIYDAIVKILPDKLVEKIDNFTSDEEDSPEGDSDWVLYLKHFIKTIVLYGILMAGVAILSGLLLYPALTNRGVHVWIAKAICILLILLGDAIFIRPMIGARSSGFTALWVADRHYHLPLITLNVLRFVLVVLLIFVPIQRFLSIHSLMLLPVVLATIFVVYRSGWFASAYINVEARFLANLNERNLQNDNEDTRRKIGEQLLVWRYECTEAVEGKTLEALDWGRRFNVNVIRMRHKEKVMNMPSASRVLHKGDIVLFLGKAEDLRNLSVTLNAVIDDELPTLFERIENQNEDFTALYTFTIPVLSHPEFAGKSIRDSRLRDKYDCMILGVLRNNLPILQPDINMILQPDDKVWILGSNHMVEKLLAEESS